MDAIISPPTRRAFEDSYVRCSVLREIENDFDDAGIDRAELPQPKSLVGQRRQLIHQYYASVDWTSPTHTRRVLQAFASHLQRLKDRKQEDDVLVLIRHLKRDIARADDRSLFAQIQAVFDADFTGRTKAVEETVPIVRTTCEQAMEHLSQAIEHLRAPRGDRARKDGLRDCLSAMESVLKTITGKKDIREATSVLRADPRWGNGSIVKDGLTTWDRIHELYPDVRHGQVSRSELTDDECLFWAERITTFVRFVIRRAEKIGKLGAESN